MSDAYMKALEMGVVLQKHHDKINFTKLNEVLKGKDLELINAQRNVALECDVITIGANGTPRHLILSLWDVAPTNPCTNTSYRHVENRVSLYVPRVQGLPQRSKRFGELLAAIRDTCILTPTTNEEMK